MSRIDLANISSADLEFLTARARFRMLDAISVVDAILDGKSNDLADAIQKVDILGKELRGLQEARNAMEGKNE